MTDVKKRLAVLLMLVGAIVCADQSSSRVNNHQRPSASPTNRDGPSFDQQRLIALFGSETQPVYGNRDPTTGRVLLETGPFATGTPGTKKSPAVHPSPPPNLEEDPVADDDEEPIDRKDTRVPETNEINPFELLPPQFHDLLNIPIHDYGNGTTYNPYDKYKVPSKSKFPLVSTGYASTKVQGQGVPSSSPTNKPKVQQTPSDDTDSGVKATKPTRRPTTPKPKVTTTSNPEPTTNKRYRPRPTTTTTTKRPVPVTRPPVYRPDSAEYDEDDDAPVQYQPKPTKPTDEDFRLPQHSQAGHPRPSHAEEPLRPQQDNRPFIKPQVQDRPFIRPSQQEPDNDGGRPFRPYQPERIVPSSFKPPARPSFEEAPTKPGGERPIFSSHFEEDDDPEEPVYIAQSFPQPGDQIAEIKVTPKPFYAADDNQSFQEQPGQVDEAPDIIYDYEDERGKGEGVLFMVDKGLSQVSSGPKLSSQPVTASPVASPYPTVASRDRPPHVNPAFRPSAPIRQGSESALFAPRPDFSVPHQQHQFLSLSPPPQQQNAFANEGGPHPSLRFPADPAQPNDKQQPNILPLFRPNTNPTDEFQFIKHPHQIDFQRPQPLPPGPGQFRPQNDAPHRNRPSGGISPLPSALQSPFSSISQAVANFFGRRSGSTAGAQRSGDLSSSTKMDRSGMAESPDAVESDEDLEMAESRSLLSRLSQSFVIRPPPAAAVATSRSDSSLVQQQPSFDPAAQQVVGIRADPEGANKKPPAFYVYTKDELEQGRPPYLVVGPVLSGPPNVAGARLVHTAPAQPMVPPDSQRRSDGPIDGLAGRPPPTNSLPFPPAAQPEFIPEPERPQVQVRKPFFPLSKGNRPSSGLSVPPRQQLPPGFLFPEDGREPVIPQGIAPLSQSITPPRVPLNPQKDVASLFSNPTLLHNRPGEEFQQSQQQAHHFGHGPALVSDHGIVIRPNTAAPAAAQNAPSTHPSLFAEPTSTPRPAKKKGPTKSPSVTTTPAYAQQFNYQQPVTYSTIQQEDGKQIAVVHPAYIVTYKNRPEPPSLESLNAPFIPSIQSPSEEGETSSIPFEKWHAMHVSTHGHHQGASGSQDSLAGASEQSETFIAPSGGKPSYHGGFVPFDPARHH